MMIIYILHNDRYYTFCLPQKIDGNHVLFDYDKDSIKRNLANIVGTNDKWILKSNSNAKIVINNEYVDSVELSLYNFYLITTSYNENIFIYVSPANDTSFVAKKITSNNPIKVGTDVTCDIILADQFVAKKQFEITKVDDSLEFKTIVDTPFLYVNGRKQNKKKLNDYEDVLEQLEIEEDDITLPTVFYIKEGELIASLSNVTEEDLVEFIINYKE